MRRLASTGDTGFLISVFTIVLGLRLTAIPHPEIGAKLATHLRLGLWDLEIDFVKTIKSFPGTTSNLYHRLFLLDLVAGLH